MKFTALHRSLGRPASPLTDDLLSAAVDAGAVETDDLDFKLRLPPTNEIANSEFPKDVAAMANSGGGLIVYGVREEQKVATGRVDVGELSEAHERTLRSVCITAISPPLSGLVIHRLAGERGRAVIVEVPPSVDGPHLIYRRDYFGAPVRNDADTWWMRERQIEAMYRARFEERRHATEALNALFEEASAGRDTDVRAWLIGVAHPRIPRSSSRLDVDAARNVFVRAQQKARNFMRVNGGVHPLDNVERQTPRPGLRRWVAANNAMSERSCWKEAWASVHHDGSVTIAAAVGAHPNGVSRYFEGWYVQSSVVECAVADLMALISTAAESTGDGEFETRVGIQWTGNDPLVISADDNPGFSYDEVSTPLHRFTPVDVTVTTGESAPDFLQQVNDLARDCVNQGGVSDLLVIAKETPAQARRA